MKKVLLIFIGFSCVVNAVNFPHEQEKRGVKRHIDEIMPQGPTIHEQLVQAVLYNDVETVERLLDETGININRRYAPHGDTLHMIAANEGNVEMVNALRARGADINIQNNMGNTALHHVLVNDDYVLLIHLLQVPHRQLNIVNQNGTTPLLAGILNDSVHTVNILLNHHLITHELDINRANNDGESPLVLAIFNADLTLLNRLLQVGAIVPTNSAFGTPLKLAIITENPALVNRILQVPGIDVNFQDEDGESALMAAAVGGNIEIVRLLLAKDALVKLKDTQGRTAIEYAQNSASDTKNVIIKILEKQKRLES